MGAFLDLQVDGRSLLPQSGRTRGLYRKSRTVLIRIMQASFLSGSIFLTSLHYRKFHFFPSIDAEQGPWSSDKSVRVIDFRRHEKFNIATHEVSSLLFLLFLSNFIVWYMPSPARSTCWDYSFIVPDLPGSPKIDNYQRKQPRCVCGLGRFESVRNAFEKNPRWSAKNTACWDL